MELLTSNSTKYEPFLEQLHALGITLIKLNLDLPEIQSTRLEETLEAKAIAASALRGGPCLVDDVGLFLKSYPNFPGALTKHVVSALGADGFSRLLVNQNQEATMVCLIGYWAHGRCMIARGESQGVLDPVRPVTHASMPLNDWFVPTVGDSGPMQHRANAIAALPTILGHAR